MEGTYSIRFSKNALSHAQPIDFAERLPCRTRHTVRLHVPAAVLCRTSSKKSGDHSNGRAPFRDIRLLWRNDRRDQEHRLDRPERSTLSKVLCDDTGLFSLQSFADVRPLPAKDASGDKQHPPQ